MRCTRLAALKDDREIVLEAAKQDGCARLRLAALKDDREIVLEAVKQNGTALKYASAALKDDCRSCWRPSSRTGVRCTTPRPR